MIVSSSLYFVPHTASTFTIVLEHKTHWKTNTHTQTNQQTNKRTTRTTYLVHHYGAPHLTPPRLHTWPLATLEQKKTVRPTLRCAPTASAAHDGDFTRGEKTHKNTTRHTKDTWTQRQKQRPPKSVTASTKKHTLRLPHYRIQRRS